MPCAAGTPKAKRSRPGGRVRAAGATFCWHGPWGSGVWMELCPACDADRPVARAFIRWYRDPDRDP
ncbi:DUF6300 family protein [Streptomyces sp. NPDC057298]|uniref:DUF6300 family protein n=1 Tax=Streptomyces sp. NPDC057298 TaxID=3346091 RepID=UPI003641156C